MSLKAHIALGTLLGLLLGAGAVAVMSRSSASTEPSAGASEHESVEDAVSPAALSGVSSSEDYRRPMRPGSRRRLLQS